MSQGLEYAAAAVQALPQWIHDQFLYFSHGDINLAVAGPVQISNPTSAGTPVSALQLHVNLLGLNQNPSNGPLHRIGILFAESYSGLPGAFGIMFDRGFSTSDDPNTAPIYFARPRQGCAVFLRPIKLSRQQSEEQFAEEVTFTTLHELGHMFNLQHDPTSLNYMKVSDPNQSYGPPAFHYTPFQQTRLEVCSQDPNVMPGSSIFGSDDAADAPRLSRSRPSANLALKLTLPRLAFHRYEPIQLGISVEISGDSAPVEIPAVIDPSNECFWLMIENDRGERALYRSPYYVCGGGDVIQISADKPYQRDFPVFGQSGGYTFLRAGAHTIWAEMDVAGGRVRSNKLRVHVEREIGLSALDREQRSTLSQPEISTLLFHREDAGDLVGLHKLARFAEKRPDIPATGEINYALARAILRSPVAASQRVDHAKRCLDRALVADHLGLHASQRALALYNSLGGPA